MYPKPLSGKSLKRMYDQAQIDDQRSDFLHRFFLAAVNLYGAVYLGELWSIYRELEKDSINQEKLDQVHEAIREQKGKTGSRGSVSEVRVKFPHLHRKDFINFSSIVRREEVPYFVMELDELYKGETRKELDRIVMHRSLKFSGRFAVYYKMEQIRGDKPFYLPDSMSEFLLYADDEYCVSEEEKKLRLFLDNLKVTASQFKDRMGNLHPCEHRGQRLKEFDFLSRDEVFMRDYISGKSGYTKGNAKKTEEYLKNRRGPESAKIMRDLRFRIYTGWTDPNMTITMLMDELNEVGVQMNRHQLEKLLNLLMDFQKRAYLWCNNGWTPEALARQSFRSGPPIISLGPGIRKSIADGEIDLDELRQQAARMGIRIINPE